MTITTTDSANAAPLGEETASPTTPPSSEIEDEDSTAATEPEATPPNEARPTATNASRESSDCSCCPLGYYVAIPILLSTFGWFTRLTQDGCDYARLTGPTMIELTNDPSLPFIEVGFHQYREPTKGDNGEWYIDYKTACEDYNTDVVDMDGVWTFAKIAGYLSLVLGGAGALFLWFSSCFLYSKTTWRWAGYELLFATVMLLLTYSWFGTSLCRGDGDRCTLSYGSKADLLSLILWVLSTISIFVRFPGPRRASTEQSNARSAPVPIELEMSQPSVNLQQMEQQQQQVSTNALDSNQPNIPEIS
ncbi:hypothetical protein ACHAWO_002249 [Cyclotella atomus]|uniref:MARVEL domain-containing protein n=1 Tax=Cyclotella atomus TaxID=382360 RepID=A0ABD3N3G4_9STRA